MEGLCAGLTLSPLHPLLATNIDGHTISSHACLARTLCVHRITLGEAVVEICYTPATYTHGESQISFSFFFFFFFYPERISKIENKPLQLSPSCYRHARDMFFDSKHFDCVYAHEKKNNLKKYIVFFVSFRCKFSRRYYQFFIF